jgi:hypothetical protein
MPSAVIGSGPIGFTDNQGKQQFIPLSQLYFDDDGNVTVKAGVVGEKNQGAVNALLKNLVAGGFLKSAPTLPPKPAIVIKAAIPGAKGNTIQVTFSKFSNIVADLPTAKTTFDAEIIAKATYSNLSVDPSSTSFIGKVLGVGATPGISPGLVRVKAPASNTPIQQPKAITSTALSLQDSTETNYYHVVPSQGDSSKPAFTLEAWKEGVDGQNIKITLIPDVNSTLQTFTLVVEWAQKISPIGLNNLPSKLAGDQDKEFVIKVSPPEGESFGIPAPGTIVLSGGADARDAVPAEKVVFSR